MNRPTPSLADVGWVWDGQAINGQWKLSIFGVGEGTRWFGLKRCNFMDRPEWQWHKVLEYIRSGVISAYSILGGFLIDLHEEQARWVRDFIAAN